MKEKEIQEQARGSCEVGEGDMSNMHYHRKSWPPAIIGWMPEHKVFRILSVSYDL